MNEPVSRLCPRGRSLVNTAYFPRSRYDTETYAHKTSAKTQGKRTTHAVWTRTLHWSAVHCKCTSKLGECASTCEKLFFLFLSDKSRFFFLHKLKIVRSGCPSRARGLILRFAHTDCVCAPCLSHFAWVVGEGKEVGFLLVISLSPSLSLSLCPLMQRSQNNFDLMRATES